MELLNILINPVKYKSTCFLCFKQNENTTDVSQKLYICDEYQTYDTTLTGIMEYLFPGHDILFNQACINCSSFLLQAFTTLQKHNLLRVKLPVFNKKLNHFKNGNCNESHITALNDKKDIEPSQVVINTYKYCKKCDMKFLTENHLKEHNKMTHNNTNNAYICEFCGKNCKKPGTLKAHLNCHKKKPCPYCAKILKSHCHYKVHIKNHEASVKKSSRRSQYPCNLCSYKSLNKNSLEAHINKVHLQKRPFVCEICSKGFYKKSNMTEHLSTHRSEKNLTCEQCGESFVTKKTLMEHRRLHSGERPFQCEICNLSFVTSGRRSDHFKRKHLEKTICCFVCDKKFSLKKELNAHMKKMHGHSKNGDGFSLITPNNFYDQHYVNGKENLVQL